MSATDISEPAFPFTGLGLSGMTLRDYLAAKAMQALATDISPNETWDEIAVDAYNAADSMLKARNA